jgi:hypothetical protein
MDLMARLLMVAWLFFAIVGYWLPLAVGCALIAGGRALQKVGARRRSRAERQRAAQSALDRLRPGLCAIEGCWRPIDATEGVLQTAHGGAELVVRCDRPTPPFVDGTLVLVVGVIDGEADDPRGAHHRAAAQLPRVLVHGSDHFVSRDIGCIEKNLARARFALRVGRVCFAIGLTVVVFTTAAFVIGQKIQHDSSHGSWRQ